MSDVVSGQNADILRAIIDGTEYGEPPTSEISELLLELKAVIEAGGGGGGGTTNYNGLTNKPQINGVILQGEKSLSDLGIINVIIDAALSGTSTNPVQNKVVKAALDAKQGKLVFDNAPTANSSNPVKSGGIKTALDAKQNTLTFDSTPTADSTNPVTSGGVKAALDAKQNTLTFDAAPTAGSNNPVKSGGIKTALDAKQNTLTFDNAPTENSNNPVKSGGIYTALAGKQNTLIFDTTPTTGSTNPVTSGGIKIALGDYYNKDEVNDIIGGLMTLSYDVVETLPTTDIDTHTIYLVPDAQTPNVYEEYLYINDQWASLGTTDVDLSNYYTKTETDDLLDDKQDTLTFDAAPTQSSTNPVTSGGVFTALAAKQDELTFDAAPTENSTNPVESGGVYTALAAKQDTLTLDTEPIEDSTNPIESGGVYTALAGKQDNLTFDTAPTANSDNPVKSGGIKTAIDTVNNKLYSTIAGIAQNNKGSMELYSVDLDTITTTGFYNAMTCTNAPYTYMVLIVCGYYLDGYCFQLAADINTGEIKTRVEYGGTWGDWTDEILDVINSKQAQTLTTPVTVDGEQKTTVETALAAINASKDKRLLVTATMPTASAEYVGDGKQRLYVGDTTATFTKGTIYECQQVPESDPPEYEWKGISSAEIDLSDYRKFFDGTLDEWDALTPEQQAEYDYIATPDGGYSGSSSDKYSTTETKTNKVWIDGKPIYRKVVVNTNFIDINNSGLVLANNIDSVVNFEVHADCYGMDYIGTFVNSYSGNEYVGTIFYTIENNNLIYNYDTYSSMALSISKIVCILEYTKTTD